MAPTRIRWDRLGRWALLFVLGLVVYLYVGPAVTWISTYREAGAKRREVTALKAVNQRLRERRRDLQSSAAHASRCTSCSTTPPPTARPSSSAGFSATNASTFTSLRPAHPG